MPGPPSCISLGTSATCNSEATFWWGLLWSSGIQISPVQVQCDQDVYENYGLMNGYIQLANLLWLKVVITVYPVFKGCFDLACVTRYHMHLQVGGPEVLAKDLVLPNAFPFSFKIISIRGTFGCANYSQARWMGRWMVFLFAFRLEWGIWTLLDGIIVVVFWP